MPAKALHSSRLPDLKYLKRKIDEFDVYAYTPKVLGVVGREEVAIGRPDQVCRSSRRLVREKRFSALSIPELDG